MLTMANPKIMGKAPRTCMAWDAHMQVSGLFNILGRTTDPVMHVALFSSISSVVAPMGQPNYASANAQLNSWANVHSLQVQLGAGHARQ